MHHFILVVPPLDRGLLAVAAIEDSVGYVDEVEDAKEPVSEKKKPDAFKVTDLGESVEMSKATYIYIMGLFDDCSGAAAQLRAAVPLVLGERPCSLCAMKFPTAAELVAHLAAAHAPPPPPGQRVVCTICEASFINQAGLEAHLKRKDVHAMKPAKTYVCKHCPETFVSSHLLGTHCRWSHAGKGAFHCAYPGCNGAFSTAGSLATHKSTCTKRPDYKRKGCRFPGCSKAYSRVDDLHKHMVDVHDWVKGTALPANPPDP